jgi:ubiquinone/menaquinone biosynthesis C-methylase UbiE
VYDEIVDRVWYDVGYRHLREAEIVRQRVASEVGVAVDAGCGPGRYTAFLVAHAKRVIAIDISKSMLELASRKAPPAERCRLDLVQADVRWLPLKSRAVDLVVNLEVLEHLPNRRDGVAVALSEFQRVLKRGGGLLVESPLSRHSWWRVLRFPAPSWKEIPNHMRREVYERTPLIVENAYRDRDIEACILNAGLRPKTKDFVRVLPAGLVERFPGVVWVDRILERIPVIRRFAREAVWCCIPEWTGEDRAGGTS